MSGTLGISIVRTNGASLHHAQVGNRSGLAVLESLSVPVRRGGGSDEDNLDGDLAGIELWDA